MIFQKNLRAGTLLYALLMLGIFSLLLQFYLQGQVVSQQGYQARQEETRAYLMAQLSYTAALDTSQPPSDTTPVPPDPQQLAFKGGTTTYQPSGDFLQVQVQLDSGATYRYQFRLLNNEEEE